MVDKKYKGIGEPNKYLVNQVFLSLSDEIMKNKKTNQEQEQGRYCLVDLYLVKSAEYVYP